MVLSILQRETYCLLLLLEIKGRSIFTGSKHHSIGRVGLGHRHYQAIKVFPSTREVREINNKVEEMHQRKFREVEKEAE